MTTPKMSPSNEMRSEAEYKASNARPQSILARDFSAALDDLFKLNGIGALEESVEQKKDEVQSQKYQLEDLDAKLRETDEKLKRLEANRHEHPRQMTGASRHGRQPVSSHSPADDEDEDDSSGDSDAQGRFSSQRGEESR